MKAQKGFTLLELMISLVILGILAAMAAPSFNKLMVSSSITADANTMVSDLALARSEAAKRGDYVTVCTSTDGATCTASGWASGRIVFSDSASAGTIGTVDSGDSVIRTTQAPSNNNTLASAGFPQTNYVTYSPTGVVVGLTGTGGTFTFCRSGYSGTVVSVSVTGRASTSATSCP